MQNYSNFIEDHLFLVSKPTFDILLKQDNPGELIALYMFYYYTAKWQKTDQIKATTIYVAKGLKWGEHYVRKIKKQLIDLQLIEDITEKENGKVSGHYIKINYIMWENRHPYSFSQCDDPHSVRNCKTNALINNNINALINNNKNSADESADISLEEQPKKIIRRSKVVNVPVRNHPSKRCAATLARKILSINPYNKKLSRENYEETINDWSIELNKLFDLGYSAEDIKETIVFVFNDEWWRTKITSAKNLVNSIDKIFPQTKQKKPVSNAIHSEKGKYDSVEYKTFNTEDE